MVIVANMRKEFLQVGKKAKLLAVNNVNFTAYNGEIFGLLGPNGAGKTTALRIIATILKPTSGIVLVDGECVIKAPEKVRKNIGFMTGETRLYDRLTVEEILIYFGKLYSIDKEQLKKRIEELIRTFELNEVRDRKVTNLSDGLRQKVSLIRTIIHDPKNLILDEPLTGLDILARRTAVDFIKEAKKLNRCVIFSTHVMSEAEELCDRIAILNKGKILYVGEKEDLKRKYRVKTLEEIFIQLIGSKDG